MRKEVFFVFKTLGLIILIIVSFLALLFIIPNNTNINSGKLYYCCSEYTSTAYEYNIKTRLSKKVRVKGYDSVLFYTPVDCGYVAIVYKNNSQDDRKYDIICNENVLVKENYVKNATYNNGYLFYIREDDNYLIRLNIKTKKCVEITDKIKYGYFFIGDFLLYSERDPKKHDIEADIVCIDYTKDEIDKQIIDQGIVFRNTNNALVYLKNGRTYLYDFDNNIPMVIEEYQFEEDSFQRRYLGKIGLNNSSYTINLKQLVLYDNKVYDDYYEYESWLMKGTIMPSREHLRLFSRIEIRQGEKRLIIPVKNCEGVNVISLKNEDKIVYNNQPCTYWIYA